MRAGILYVLFFLIILTSNGMSSPGPCCYVNPNYAGVCVVDPAPGETCASILDYLNSPGTVGKTYCGGTIIRGGWKQVNCR